MPSINTRLEQSRVEIINPHRNNTLVVVSFDIGGSKFGTIQLSAGSKQHFDKFSRLTITASGGSINFQMINPSPLVVDIYLETKNDRKFLTTLGVNRKNNFSISVGQQLFLLPRVSQYIPPPPRIVQALYKRNNILIPEDNVVELFWVYPPKDLPKIIGFNHYWAKYDGNLPLGIQKLNTEPIMNNFFGIYDFVVHKRENHRYAVTAIGKNGEESLFSNVMILDKTCLRKLIDAGFIPL